MSRGLVEQRGREELVLAWRRGEERLYPVVMVRPELYEWYVRLVRAIADELGDVRSEDALVNAYRERSSLAEDVAVRLELPLSELDLPLARDAAFCLRHRDLVGELQREEARRRVERAREAGEEWVVVFEQSLRGFQPPYRLVEMHVRSGRSIHSFVEQSADTARPVFGVEVIRLDPMSGDWMPDAEPEAREEFDDPDVWRARVDALRRADAVPEATEKEEE
jgi:hypothetical protein